MVAWAISEKVQGIDDEMPRPEEIVEWKSQLMGYSSAMLYCKRSFALQTGSRTHAIPTVGSRIPQIGEFWE
jgi:hypothetical protein